MHIFMKRRRLIASVAIMLFFTIIALIVFLLYTSGKRSRDYRISINNYTVSMQDGKPDQALYWANKYYKAHKAIGFDEPSKKWTIGVAYELKGDFTDALEIYKEYDDELLQYKLKQYHKDFPEFNFRNLKNETARLKFKEGKFDESFAYYCSFVTEFFEMSDYTLKDYDSPTIMREFRLAITLEDDPTLTRISSFLDFSDFRRFMEQEYMKSKQSQKYAQEISFIQKVDQSKEVLDEIIWGDLQNLTNPNNPRGNAYRFWNRLKEERKGLARKD